MATRTLLATSGTVNWSTAGNWSGGAVPANGDVVIIGAGNANITGGLNQSAVTLAELVVADTFQGTIGEAPLTGAPGADLQIKSAIIAIGRPISTEGTGSGSGRIRLDIGSTAAAVTIYNTGASLDSVFGLEAFRLKGTAASGNKLHILDGSASFGADAGTYALGELVIEQGTASIGSGTTVGTVEQLGGRLIINGTIGTSITQAAGELHVFGSALLPAAYIAGTAYLSNRTASGASFTTLNARSKGVIDFTHDPRAFSVTNAVKAFAGSRLIFVTPAQATMAAGGGVQIKSEGCRLTEIAIDAGLQAQATIVAG